MTIKIEKSEMKSQERMKDKKFSRGGSSSGKRPRESQVDSIQVRLQGVGDKDLP